MAEWEINHPIDYSANGDDIDTFAQKSKATFEQIFSLLNKLRSNGAQAGTDISNAVPFAWIIDTSTETLYMTKMEDGQLVLKELGDIDTYFGLTADKIGAVKSRDKSMGSIMRGADANKPEEGNTTHDWYWAYDTGKIYSWTGSAWKVEFSLNFVDMRDYERYCVAKSEVATSGANKILRLDSQGNANVNITGSPERLLGLLIDVQNLRDDHVLVYDAAKGKIVNKPRNDINEDDITYTGEAGKVAGIAEDGKLHANLEGSASEIDELVVDATGMQEGQVLSLQNGRLKPVNKDDITDDDISVTVTAGKLVKGNAQNKVEGSITGTAEGLHDIFVNGANIADGYILRYHALDNSLHFEPVGAVGDAASLVLTADGQTKINYNGSKSVMVDMADILGPEYLNILRYYTRFTQMERELANVVLQMEAEGMMPDCNLLLAEDFEYPDKIDQLTVKVTSCAAGDDSVDVELNYGFIVGSWYWITDGANAEYVQIKSVIKNGNIYRLILTEPLVNTYEVSMTSMYRTTAWIKDGIAFGSGDVLGWVYDPKVTWRGITSGSSAENDEEWQTGLDYKDNFTMTDDALFTPDGLVSLG